MRSKESVIYATAFNEYTRVREIGQGGSGTVLEVSDVEGKKFALKVIDPSKTSTQTLKRFQNEIAFCQKNTHSNLIKVLDHGRGPNKAPFYVMPLYDTALEKLIQKGIPPHDILRVFGQILDGVEAAHLKHVTHRDLKPQNVLCDLKEGRFVVADFGIASFEEEDLYTAIETKDNERLANFQYAAPEQRARGRQVTNKADIFALGLILNEMFTREIPQGTGFRSIASVQGDYGYLDALVDQMVRQDATQRPDIEEIKKQLIARRNQAISLQRVDQLTKQVVPKTDTDDLLVREPIQIAGVDYKNGTLFVTLSQSPNPSWIEAFNNQGNYGSFVGYEPQRTYFSGNTAQLGTPSGCEQEQIDHLKTWINNANDLYKQHVEMEMQARRRRQQQELEQETRNEQERQNVLKKIKW